MKVIHKYRLEITDEQTVKMPPYAHVLKVGLDPAGDLCIWALVDSEELPTEDYKFAVFGTGHPIPDEYDWHEWLGSVTQGPFVWHVFGG